MNICEDLTREKTRRPIGRSPLPPIIRRSFDMGDFVTIAEGDFVIFGGIVAIEKINLAIGIDNSCVWEAYS